MTASSANEKLKNILRAGKLFESKYRILRPLGAGSFAVVVHAKHEVMGRDVALKFLKPKVVAQNPEVSERFIKEVQIASKLKHPNVVTIFDFGKTEDGIYYMVQEFVDGDTLDHVIESTPNQILPMPRVLSIIRQVLSCLVQAHEFNIIHRDLKPSNLMSMQREGKEVIKILDFGVAKLLEPDKNPGGSRQSTKFIGTPIYMSPEQILGLQVQASSDLYSLGLIFYELLTGEPPMEAEQVAEVVQQHLDEEPFKFPSLGKLPINIQKIILKATNRFPEKRFTTAQSFIDALEGRAPAPEESSTAASAEPKDDKFFGLSVEDKQQKSGDDLDIFLGRNYIDMSAEDYPESDFNPIIEKKMKDKPAPPKPADAARSIVEPLKVDSPPPREQASTSPTVDSALTQMPRDLELDMDVVRQVQRSRQTVSAPAIQKSPSSSSDIHSAVTPPASKDHVGRTLLYLAAFLTHFVMYIWITSLTDGMPGVSRVIIALFPLVGVVLWAAFGHSTNSKAIGDRWLIPIAIRSLIVFAVVALGVLLFLPARGEIAFTHEGTWGIGFMPEAIQKGIGSAMAGLGALCGKLADALPWGR